MSKHAVYLIPSLLDEEDISGISPNIVEVVKKCQVFFVENERSARRFLKKAWKEIVIDDYEWFKVSDTLQVSDTFKQKIKEQKNIGIISDAGCPGIADPGQQLVALAHEMNVVVKPLVGPSSILLALMGSGMNGQNFEFVGYLPVKDPERIKSIKELESVSQKKKSTQIFIETPYRNNQLIEALLKNCRQSPRLCIAVDLTGGNEWIRTKTIGEWKKQIPDIHKCPAIYCLLA